jgi:hypothetical protein
MTLLYSAAVRRQARLVRRRGLSFRFSGGFAGPRQSVIGRLSGQDGVPLLAGVQDRRHISRTVVSTLLARSHSQMGAAAGGSRHPSLA